MPEILRVEACFQKALAMARGQQANALELRAAMSLSRLWQRQGKEEAASERLTPIYGWFTEGLATPALPKVQALLRSCPDNCNTSPAISHTAPNCGTIS
jgi:predicted ATPase